MARAKPKAKRKARVKRAAVAQAVDNTKEQIKTQVIQSGQITTGKCSWFGGPDDNGVAADEGLAFIFNVDEAPHLFLPEQPDGTTGLARRLNPDVYYIAMRFDYDETPKDVLKDDVVAMVSAHGKTFFAYPADWGPHQDTGRLIDLSPGLMDALGVKTDEDVQVLFPIYKRKPKVLAIA